MYTLATLKIKLQLLPNKYSTTNYKKNLTLKFKKEQSVFNLYIFL